MELVEIDWDRLTPVEQSEAAVLSGVLRENELYDEIKLSPDDFYSPRFGHTWELMGKLRSRGEPIDPTVLGRYEPTNVAMFWDLTSLNYTATDYHVELVAEAATRRKLELAAIRVKNLAEQINIPISEVEDLCRAEVDAAIGVRLGAVPTSTEVARLVIDGIGKSMPGFATPWPRLSQAIRGLRRGGMYVLGARPGVGKSIIALQLAAALEHFGHVGYFTLEMSKEEVTKRLIAQQTGIAYRMIDGTSGLPEYAQSRVDNWFAQYQGRIMFDDRGAITVSDIRSQVRTWSRDPATAPVAIVVDYLQLMTGGTAHGADRVAIVGEISRQLKLIARDFNIVVIALSQLNRNPEGRADKVPVLSDLRESGSIEQDADVVILLNRDMTLVGEAESFIDLIIAKNRQGPTGTIELMFEGHFMRATGGEVADVSGQN